MYRRTVPLLVLSLTVACGTPLENTSSQLLEQVRLGDPRAQQTYADNKELLESPEALPIWLRALEEDDSAQVQEWAAQMLGNIGDPRALPALARAMSGARNVRDAAADAIRQFDDQQATDAFVAVLTEGSRDAKALALAQISRTGGTSAVQPVADVAAGDDELLAGTALNTLGDIGTAEAAAALAAIASDASIDEGRRSAAITNLGRIEAEGAAAMIEQVVAALADQEGAEALLAQAQALKR